MKPFFIAFLIPWLFTGCLAPASKISKVSLGMNKAQVLKVMGKPVSVTADPTGEYLNYNLAEVPTYFDMPGTPYEIKLVNGVVVSFGRAGDPQNKNQPAVLLVK